MSDLKRKLEEAEAHKNLTPEFLTGIQARLDAGDIMFKRTDVITLMLLHRNTEKMMNSMIPPMAELFSACMAAGLIVIHPPKPGDQGGGGSPNLVDFGTGGLN